jgi:hypothetical protein
MSEALVELQLPLPWPAEQNRLGMLPVADRFQVRRKSRALHPGSSSRDEVVVDELMRARTNVLYVTANGMSAPPTSHIEVLADLRRGADERAHATECAPEQPAHRLSATRCAAAIGKSSVESGHSGLSRYACVVLNSAVSTQRLRWYRNPQRSHGPDNAVAP